jgi:type IX secretion system PorP/SprF family membrane protein
VLSADLPVFPLKGGVGLTLSNDVSGAQRVTNLKLAVARQAKISANGMLSVGISAGAIQHALDGTKLRAPEGDYPDDNSSINHNDPKIPSALVSDVVPDFGLGAVLRFPRFWAGVGVTHLLEPASSLNVSGVGITEITFSRHYFIQGGMDFSLGEDFRATPAWMLKSDLVVYQLELQSRFIYRNNIWAGLAFRGFSSASMDALIGMVGLNISSALGAGYAYDLNISKFNRVNSGSHELIITYLIPIEPPSRGKIINNPRYIAY